MKNKHFEAELPERYVAAKVIDATSKKTGLILNALALVLGAAIIAPAFIMIKPTEFFEQYSFLRNIIFLGVMIAYIILHELVHGAVYKLMTGHKLSFGISATCAWCGVPDIYVYRRAALSALVAPLLVFIPVFLLPAILLSGEWDKIYAYILLGIHVGGCVGDIYDTLLYLFKFRSPDTLMRDTGPRQTFYVREK